MVPYRISNGRMIEPKVDYLRDWDAHLPVHLVMFLPWLFDFQIFLYVKGWPSKDYMFCHLEMVPMTPPN